VNIGGILVSMKGARAEEELRLLSTEQTETELILKNQHMYQLPYGNEERTIFTFIKKSFT